MRCFGLLAACAAAILAGIAVGAIPFVNENLHWNIWFVVPISGALLGAAFGWVQFQIARAFSVRVGTAAAVALALAATVGYLGTDLGTYWTTAVELEQMDGFEAGEYQLHDLVSFSDYMRARLTSSSIDLRPGRSDSTVELGAAAATVSFGFDLIGAWLGSFLILVGVARGTPYCDRCHQYKRRLGGTEIPLEASTAVEVLDQLQEQVQGGSYECVVSLLNSLTKREPPEELMLKISTDERTCPGCNETTLTCRVLRLQGNEWKEVAELRSTSGIGDTARLTSRP